MVLGPSPTYIAVGGRARRGRWRAEGPQPNQPVLAMPLPVVAAGVVSVLVFLAVKHWLPADPLYGVGAARWCLPSGGMLTSGWWSWCTATW